jgi:hypothetical protein
MPHSFRRSILRTLWVSLALQASAGGLLGQVIPPRRLPGAVVPPVTAWGISGQFVVSSATGATPRIGIIPEAAAADEIVLEPQLLAVAAERVKHAVLTRFDSGDQWRGKIHIYIRPKRELGNTPIRIVPVSFPGGWQYRMDVPDEVEWRRLVRALVEVVLLEAANRDMGEHVGLPPLWVNEGVAFLVIADQGRDLILEGHKAVRRNERKLSLLTEARRMLDGRTPLLFSELSFPPDSLPNDAALWPAYQASAALLTHELLSDDAGRRSMGQFLRGLPRCLNWQTAFLEAHRSRFLSALEVEKWWAVNSIHVLGRDPALLWTRAVTLDHLAAIQTENVEIGRGTNGPVQRGAVPLSQVLVQWDGATQREVIRRKEAQLRELYQHAPIDLLPLVTEYYRTLQQYAADRYGTGSSNLRRAELEQRSRVVATRASRRLQELDRKLAGLRETARKQP